MKLISAKFKNFRLLRDVFIEFSTDSEKKLTVIRADNGTGKTTAMSGLIWGLYGSKLVSEKLYPLPLAESGQLEINIEVQIDFETDEVISSRGHNTVQHKVYRLIRSCTEYVSQDKQSHRRSADDVKLFEKTEEGYKPVLQSNIESIIQRALPQHLKDIYFTDGDKALTFIESTVSGKEKRLRVQKAIESLLSMKDLESLIKNLKSVKLAFLKQIDKSDYSTKLIDTETIIQDKEEWISGSEEDLDELLDQQSKYQDDLKSLDKKIEEQLRLGNKEALVQEIKGVSKRINTAETLKVNSIKSLCLLLNSRSIASSLISKRLEPAIKLLEDMNARDNFPKQFIPVLNDILKREKCVCGENLSHDSLTSREKRSYIEGVIKESKEVDLINARASNLYFTSSDYVEDKVWQSEYGSYTESYFNSDTTLRDAKDELRKKLAIVDEIDDQLLIDYREQRKRVHDLLMESSSEITVIKDNIDKNKSLIVELKKEAEVYSNRLNKKNNAGAKHRLAEALNVIYTNVFETIKTTELKKVSSEMNRIFLSMIGVDLDIDQQGGVIRRAELSSDFDIKVYGPNDQPMNPDTELNGASRRAISLAFILALTKVSKVKAANIIDTPLGMTSGLVKASIVENLINEGSQIILFLTYDEIKGVEPILKKYAGKEVTLSFSGHYPKMLRNKPLNEGVTALCECSHEEFCSICERNDQVNLVERVV